MKKLMSYILVAALLISVLPTAILASGNDLSSKLIGEWNFDDETTGTATLYNNADTATGTYVDGVSGKALKLSTQGTDEKYWLSVPYSTFGENKDSFTLSIWYNATGHNTSGENSELFSLYNSSAEKFLFYGAQFDGSANGFTMKWDGTYGYANVIGGYKENEWVHLVFAVDVVDGKSKITAYVNGVAVEVDQGGEWANSLMSQLGIDTFTIGGKNPYKGGPTPNCLFYGMVDEIQLYAGALTADEASKLYDEVINPALERGTLLGEWNFDDETTGTATLYNNADTATGTYVDGVSGKALKLSTQGTDEKYWLSIPYSTFGKNKDSFTLSIWYNATGHNTSGENSELFSLYNSSAEKFLFYGAQFDGSANGFTMKWDGTYGYANVIGGYKENEWVHLVFAVDVVDGKSKITAYVNGNPVEVDQGGEWANSLMSQLGIDTFTIGGKNPYKGGPTPNCLFYGSVDEIQLYAGALTADEAMRLYDNVMNGESEETEPDNPDNPDNPENPENPENPDNPDNPDNPENPENPDNPDTPVEIPDMPDGLIGYWDMDGDLADSVGGKDATLHEQVDSVNPSFVPGVLGSALKLSTHGTDERYWLSIPYSVFGSNPDTFSLSIWYNATGYNTAGEDSQLFSFYNSSAEKFLFYSPAAINFQDKGFTMKWDSTYGYANIITPHVANEWKHLVFTVSADGNKSVIKAYVNGVEVEVDQGGEWVNSLMSQLGIDTFTIGGMNPHKGSTNCRFYGYVDEVRVYDHALSADEAMAIYLNATANPKTGDNTDLLTPVVLMIVACMAMIVLPVIKRRENQ